MKMRETCFCPDLPVAEQQLYTVEKDLTEQVKKAFLAYFLYLVADRPMTGTPFTEIYTWSGVNTEKFNTYLDGWKKYLPENPAGVICTNGGGVGRAQTNANQLLRWMISQVPVEKDADPFKDNWDNVRYHSFELAYHTLFVIKTPGKNEFCFYIPSQYTICCILESLAVDLKTNDGVDTSNFISAANKYGLELSDSVPVRKEGL